MNESVYGMPLSRLSCFAMVEENGKAWFARTQANGLYEFDKIENRAKLLMHFSDFSIDKGYLYSDIDKVGSTLVLAPASASKVVLYDLVGDMAEYFELAPIETERKVKYIGVRNFLKSYEHEGSVYLFGFEYPAVLKIDVKTKKIVYFTDWIKKVERRIKKVSAIMGYVSDYVVVGDYVWALCQCADVVLCLDLRTDEIRIVDICSDLDIRVGICFDGDFWVTGYNQNANKLLKYDSSFVLKKKIEIASAKKDGGEYSLSPQGKSWMYMYYPIINLGDRLLLFSVYPRHVYEFDKTLQKVQICSIFEELIEVWDEKLHAMGILAPRKNGNLVRFITGNDFLWNEYDFLHDTITRYEVRTESDEKLLTIKFMGGRIFIENKITRNLGGELTLSRFLGHLAYVPKVEVDDMGKDNVVGTEIHEKNDKEVSG